uniref:Uncharacterized protein n=1 Tax=Rhodnius prolixus TaxID=13249 RepID=T1I0U7_RHOPR
MSDGLKKEANSVIYKKNSTPEIDKSERKRTRSSPDQLESGPFMKKISANVNKEKCEMGENLILKKLNEMDLKLSQVATKADLKETNEKLENLITENKNLKEEIVDLKKENKQVKESLEFALRKLKSKSLVIAGLQDLKENNDYTQEVKELCVKSLGMHEPMIDRAHSVAQGRLLLVELVRQADVQAMLINAKKLKGSGIWINRDLTYQDRQKKKKLLEIRKKIMAVDKVEKVLVRDGYLLYKKKKFYWDEEKGITASKEDDLSLINECFGRREQAMAVQSKNLIA